MLKVNRSTYYKLFSAPPAPKVIENQEICSKILTIYSSSDKRIGIYKISKILAVEYGINISSGDVYRLMKSINFPKMSTAKPAFKPFSLSKKPDAELISHAFNCAYVKRNPDETLYSNVTLSTIK